MTQAHLWRSVARWSWLFLLVLAAIASAVIAGGDQEPSLTVHAIPSSDGRKVWMQAGVVGATGTAVAIFCDVSGPGMNCDTSDSSIAVTGLTPETTVESEVSVTVILSPTQVLETGPLPFIRAYVPATAPQTVHSVDGNLELTLVSQDTIPIDTYIMVIPSGAPPGPAPPGHRFVGNAYGVRASGALLVTEKPMSLRLYYDETALAGTDPHTLAIFAWDAFNEHWVDLGGRLFDDAPEGHYLSVAASRLTTYALMATPAWRDGFDDLSGVNFAETSNVALYPQVDNSELVLSSMPGSGIAVSKPITSTTVITDWGSLTFTRTVDPPTTTLTVDVLSMDGTELLTDVTSGTSLAGIDPVQYPSLRLRANLSSTVAGETPALDQWRLTWQSWLCYDVNDDDEVDIADIQAVASHWHGLLPYDSRYDLVPDGIIDILDVMKAVAHWGERCGG